MVGTGSAFNVSEPRRPDEEPFVEKQTRIDEWLWLFRLAADSPVTSDRFGAGEVLVALLPSEGCAEGV